MYGDFSRLTFAPERHLAAVLVQQGRVQLDADANEQAAILLHLLRTLATDLIGPWGAPAADAGFQLGLELDEQGRLVDLTIAPGRLYVAGILCENEELDPNGEPQAFSYFHQPDAYFDPDDADDRLPAPPFLVYLRVHERHLTAIEDPSLREVALGDNGPDTCSRAKVVWQVRVTDEAPGGEKPLADLTSDEIVTGWAQWQRTTAEGRGRLRARARQPDAADADPCITSPEASYRGPENQLYRIEVHTGGEAGGAGDATFTWSRENGSVALAITSPPAGAVVEVASLGRDGRLGLEPGDFVEVVDDRYALRMRPGRLLRVKEVDPLDLRVVLWEAVPDGIGDDPALHPLLRRWDHRERPAAAGGVPLADDNALEIVETTDGEDHWIELEDGVQVQFAQGGRYRPGDFWLVPARTATGDVEWPRSGDEPDFRRPAGVAVHTAPLAVVRGLESGQLEDLRCLFDRLACPPTAGGGS
jgi:hypothetical protein